MRIKSLHLILSASVVLVASLIYGAHPEKIIPLFFDFRVENLEHKNIFRAIMGLYIAFGLFWIYGIRNSNFWRMATISNVIFMGGLAFGRLISLIFDGLSIQYGIGMVLELLVMFWGIYNLKNENKFS